jgi:hypothetical protein
MNTHLALLAFTGALALLAAQDQATTQAETSLLKLEAKIPIGNVNGRIDHMAIDLAQQRLFVAELGNNTVGIVDLNSHSVIRRLEGLKEPQGVAYLPSTDTLYVANGGDGSVHLFRGADYKASGQIDLRDDADNIRIDIRANQIVVGYGSGGIAVIDASSSRKIVDIPLSVHPEGFSARSWRQPDFRQSSKSAGYRGCRSPVRSTDGHLADENCGQQFPNGA